MKNRYNLDVSYFTGKLNLIIRDIDNYTHDEMFTELSRLADVAGRSRGCNHQFQPHWNYSECKLCGAINIKNTKLNREDWGVAAGKQFKSIEEAKFYQKNGRLPN